MRFGSCLEWLLYTEAEIVTNSRVLHGFLAVVAARVLGSKLLASIGGTWPKLVLKSNMWRRPAVIITVVIMIIVIKILKRIATVLGGAL